MSRLLNQHRLPLHSGAFHLVLFLTITLSAGAMFAPDREKSNVVPPNARFQGLSYAEWSAKHWQWLLSLPIDGHPLFDTADVSAGQDGKVWFIGGTFSSLEIEPGVIVGAATRSVNIPVGKALFFPLVDVEGSTIEGNGETEAELRAFANFIADFIDPDDVFLTIDGNPVRNVESLRTDSPAFTFGPLPDNNVIQFFGIDAPAGTTSLSVSDGYFAMLKPLSVGTHTLHFGGIVDLSPIGGPMFIQDIHYTIRILPKGK